MTRHPLLVVAVSVAVAAGCASAGDDASPGTSVTASTTSTTLGETASMELGSSERPAQLVAPEDVTAPAPLLVLLHGYGANAEAQDAYLGVTEQAATRGMYVLLPDGSMSESGRRFWDARAACCNFRDDPVDDVGYLTDLIDEVMEERPIDPDRVYLFGHSNGGFMSYRMACDRSELIAAVAVLAGSDPPEVDDCEPSGPVSVLHLHGTDDEVVSYDGGTFAASFPGAEETVERWADRDGCDEAATEGTPLDLDSGLDGAETAVSVYAGCAGGAVVQLDTIDGGSHIPALTHEVVGTQVLDWLLARSR